MGMTPNQIISERYLKSKGYKKGPAPDKWSCDAKTGWFKEGDSMCLDCMGTNYSDIEAWTPELYDWIEGEGLWISFKLELWQIFIKDEWVNHKRKVTTSDTVRAYTEQKAEALSRAIGEDDT